jgi:DHA3 family multidrug efflux protein-like MFS transporter
MMLTTATSTACFAAATVLFLLSDADQVLRMRSPWFWLVVALTLLGSVAGQMRGIALSTCVTLLVPENRRDKANGLVGTITGVSFAITSVFSGLVIGNLGMGWALYLALALTVGALVHLRTIHIAETVPSSTDGSTSRIDIRCHEGHSRRAWTVHAHPARRVQQPARWGVHGAHGRLRS